MKNVIIFGTGEFAKETYRFYKSKIDVNILFFSDNNLSKHYTMFFDIEIIPPEKLPFIKYDEILISSSFDNQIYQQLLELNIEKEKIKILNLNQVKIQFENGKRLLLAERIMLDIANFFNINNISYHIDHGTLLGIIRDNSLLSWDIDVDFAIQDKDKDVVLELLKNYLKGYQVVYCEKNNWKCDIYNCDINFDNEIKSLPMVIKVFNDVEDSISNLFFVDIELKYEYKNNLYWMIGSRKLFAPLEICFPSTSILFKGHVLQTPRCIEDYLINLYGNWKKVIKEWSYEQYANIEEIK